MSTTDELLRNNKDYAAKFDKGHLPMPPGKKIAVIACMDARLDIYRMLGLSEGDAHVIRNAGGIVSEDVIRSLAISQWLLGTEEIILIHHTDCGMLTFRDHELSERLEEELGIRPPFSFDTFDDPAADVRQSMNRIQSSPFIPKKGAMRGFVFDVKSGRLNEV